MSNLVFWAAIGVVSIGLMLIVASPLLRAGERIGRVRRASYDLAVFRDQLAEVERDQEAGRLNPAEAAAARGEIERRMLKTVDGAADSALSDAATAAGSKMGAAFPIASGLVVAGVAVALYLNIGAPQATDMPFALRTDVAGPAGEQSSVDGQAMVQNLQQRLAADPNDQAGWVTLARTYRVLGDHQQAVRAFDRALGLAGRDAPAELIADYGETLVFESFGTVSPRAIETFEQALAKDPRDIKSRFYIAMGRGQAGDYRGAIALWRGLSADAPPDAPWLPAVQERIADAAMKGNILPMSVSPERPGPAGLRGAIAGDAKPTADDVQAVQEMAPEDQQAFIRSMVSRLAEKMEANPNDVDGWLRLGRAYQVLNEPKQAAAAFERAKTRLVDILANTPAESPSRPGVEATLREVEDLLRQ